MTNPDYSNVSLPPAVGSSAASTRAAAPTDTIDLNVSNILKMRRRPLLLLIDEAGDLLYSTLHDSAPPAEHRLVGQALAEAKALFHAELVPDADRDLDGSPLGNQRWSLIVLDNTVYSVRLCPLHRAGDAPAEDHYAVVIEPIAGSQPVGIDFATIKSRFRLSNRELDVLSALMTGTKDKQIARELGVSVGTVRAYLKSVRAKLGVTTRTAAVNLVHEAAGKGPP